jgi:hypothetical protein
MDANRGPIRSGLLLLFGLYFAVTGIVFVPYYNWQYAREHGFVAWLFLGEVMATTKALAWPYFMLAGAPARNATAKPFRGWSAEEKANSKHFQLSIQADLQSIQLSRERANAELSASERREILMLKDTAIREARLVSPEVLRKIHPDLARHLAAEYVAGLEYRIRHLSLPGGDSDADRQGLALHDAWADWFNANRNAMLVPK